MRTHTPCTHSDTHRHTLVLASRTYPGRVQAPAPLVLRAFQAHWFRPHVPFSGGNSHDPHFQTGAGITESPTAALTTGPVPTPHTAHSHRCTHARWTSPQGRFMEPPTPATGPRRRLASPQPASALDGGVGLAALVHTEKGTPSFADLPSDRQASSAGSGVGDVFLQLRKLQDRTAGDRAWALPRGSIDMGRSLGLAGPYSLYLCSHLVMEARLPSQSRRTGIR